MPELTLIKSAKFGEIQADIYQKDNEPYMTAEQLGQCLGYSHPRENINKLISRNSYLRNSEFSAEVKMTSPRGDKQSTRIFTEDGIYEVTFLAKTEKAEEFRAWVRRLLKSLRRGNVKLVGMTDYQKHTVQIRERAAHIKAAQLLERIANQYDGTFRQILHAHATKELSGEYLVPLPQLPKRTYSASEIGDMLGISANKVGILANQNGLKTDEYGAYFNDKAKHSNKEVQSFRYYENVLPELQDLLRK